LGVIEEFLQCDRVYVANISHQPPHALIEAFLINACFPKKVAELALTIKATQATLGVDADLHFSGEVIGSGAGQDPIVRWSIDQHVAGFHVIGQLDTVLRLIGRHTVPRCQDPSRSFQVEITTIDSSQSEIRVKGQLGSKSFLGISLDAEAGRRTPVITARIEVERDECGIGAAPGGVQVFRGYIDGIDQDDAQFSWSVGTPDATVLPSGSPSTLRVRAGNGPLSVTLKVTATGLTATASVSYLPETDQSILIKTFVCRIRRQLIHQIARVGTRIEGGLFRDPIWDPIRNLSTTPLDHTEMLRGLAAARRLGDAVQTLERGLRRAGTPGPRGTGKEGL
jgi:hypothetical protein